MKDIERLTNDPHLSIFIRKFIVLSGTISHKERSIHASHTFLEHATDCFSTANHNTILQNITSMMNCYFLLHLQMEMEIHLRVSFSPMRLIDSVLVWTTC
jgi:hypothetical protein